MQNESNRSIKQVKGELVDSRQQAASSRALDSLSLSLSQDGVLARLLQPKEQRMIRREWRQRIMDATVEDAIEKVSSEARKRCEELELLAQSHRHRLLLEQNASMGRLKQQEQEVVSHEINHLVSAERVDQRRLSQTRLLDEDRDMLSQLFKQRTASEMLSIAHTHGVNVAKRSTPSEPDSDAEQESRISRNALASGSRKP